MIGRMAVYRRLAIAAVLAAGCGRFGFDRSEVIGDSSPDSDSSLPTDTPPDGALGAFGPATKISFSLTNKLEDDPTLTADLLEMIFESDRMGGLGGSDLWITRRPTIGGAWATPIPIVELNGGDSEEHPGLSSDGLTVWFASDRNGGLGSFDIYVSTRPNRSSGTPWSTPVLASSLNDGTNNESPQVSSSELVMVMASGPNGDEDLFSSTRGSITSAWPAPTPITELNQSTTSETAPMLSSDGLAIYFTSNRGGGGAELFVATRATPSATFDTPVPIGELDANLEQTDPWISPDQRTIVFASDQDGTRDLFEATR